MTYHYDLIYHIKPEITSGLISSLEENVHSLSTELFQKIIDDSVLEFSWYIQYPEKSKMIVRAFAKSDTSQLRWDSQKTIRLLMWFLKGFNEVFLRTVQMQSHDGLKEVEKTIWKV